MARETGRTGRTVRAQSGIGETGGIVWGGAKDVIVKSGIRDGAAGSVLAEVLEPKNPMEMLGRLGKTGEEIAEKQVVIGSWMPEYEYDIVTEFPFGESGEDDLPF